MKKDAPVIVGTATSRQECLFWRQNYRNQLIVKLLSRFEVNYLTTHSPKLVSGRYFSCLFELSKEFTPHVWSQ